MPQPVPGEALRIGATANTMTEAVDAWLSNLSSRGKKPGTIRTYRCLLESSTPALGWRTTQDINADSLAEWMAAKREAGVWKGVTLNHNLSAFKSFTRFLTKTKWLASDPLAALDRAEDDGDDGSRAATTEEARAIIRYAWSRQKLDRRARGSRALVWASCFLMGLRAGEPEKLRWRHVLLDEEIPVCRWERSISKNRKLAEVAIAPELVPLLREHRDTIAHGLDDAVFPIVPPRHTFNSDRDNAGIVAVDTRGRRLSSHGARKWAATTLTTENVNPRIIDKILRHSGGVQGRYADVSLAEQLSALSRLPALWPENCEAWVKIASKKRVDTPGEITDKGDVTLATVSNSASPPRSAVHASVTTSARRRGDSEFLGQSPFGLQTDQHDNGQGRVLRVGHDSGSDVAALLRAVANLIERAGPKGPANDNCERSA